MWFLAWVCLGLVLAVTEVVMLRRHRRASIDGGWTDNVMQVVTVLTTSLGLLLGAIFGRSGFWESLIWVWFVTGLAGVTLRVLAMEKLQADFTLSLNAAGPETIVTDGVYGYVRHPGYTGLLVALTAMACLAGNVLVVVPVAGLWAAAVLRIREEERFLARDQNYLWYADDVRYRLVPYLW